MLGCLGTAVVLHLVYLLNFINNSDKFHTTASVIRNFISNLEPVSNNFQRVALGNLIGAVQ